MIVFTVQGIAVQLHYKQVKRLHLHVTQQGVWMSAPHCVSVQEAENFVHTHMDWIIARKATYAQNSMCDKVVQVWGESVPVVWKQGAGVAVHTKDTLTLFVAHVEQAEQKRAALQAFYRAQVQNRLPAACAHWEAETGIGATEYRLRDMKTRWGTCNIRARRIWLNVLLAAYPPNCLDYVLVHELTHLLVPNHSAAFWQQVARFYPDFRTAKWQLKQGPCDIAIGV